MNRWEKVIELLRERPHAVGAEVGVWKGILAKHVLRALPSIEKYYCIDPWELYDDHKLTLRPGSEELNMSHNKVFRIFLKNTKLWQDKRVIIRELSQDALGYIEDESLDWVFIDANHSYKHTKADIIGWTAKVKPGGLISGHDIIDKQAIRRNIKRIVPFGVREAVEELLTDWDMNAEANIWWTTKTS